MNSVGLVHEEQYNPSYDKVNNPGKFSSYNFGYRFPPMTTFSERILISREHAGFTQEVLAERVGISQPGIQKLERNAQTSRYLVQIARACGVRPEWLQSGHGDMVAQRPSEPASLSGSSPILSWSNADTLPEGFRVVPRYRMAFSMGDGRVMFEVQEYEDGDAFRSNWLSNMGIKPDSCFIAKVEGSSMEPKLEEGESVLVDRAQTRVIDRKIYAVCYDGQIYCKRLFKAGNEIIMRSDNLAYPEIRAQAEDVEIIGRIVWHAGKL
jgi:phage repressor protein C with HTH and peptisase S24 domain